MEWCKIKELQMRKPDVPEHEGAAQIFDRYETCDSLPEQAFENITAIATVRVRAPLSRFKYPMHQVSDTACQCKKPSGLH